jgi:hypothetical protein
MKILVIPILILLVATQAFSKWVLLLEFQWNRDYIAANLCENRTKPMLHCGGKCQLMKKLAADEKQQAPVQGPAGKSAFQEVLFTATATTPYILPKARKMSAQVAMLQHWKTFNPPCCVFRPPLA